MCVYDFGSIPVLFEVLKSLSGCNRKYDLSSYQIIEIRYLVLLFVNAALRDALVVDPIL